MRVPRRCHTVGRGKCARFVQGSPASIHKSTWASAHDLFCVGFDDAGQHHEVLQPMGLGAGHVSDCGGRKIIRMPLVFSSELIHTSHKTFMATTKAQEGDLVQGTLDMLILKTLITGPAHGHTIAHVIEHTSENVLEVEQGSLYPALHRLEDRGWVTSYWGTSENNRKAKFYKLTPAGRKQLTEEARRWRRVVRAIGRILGEAAE